MPLAQVIPCSPPPLRISRSPRRRVEPVSRILELTGLHGLVRGLEQTGQLDELTSAAPFTLLAPSDEALAELPSSVLERPALLSRLLAFHIIPGQLVDSEALRDEPGLTTSLGQRVHAELEDDDAVHIDGARLVRSDLRAGAGIVHVLDRVLVPAELDVIELLHLSDSFPRLVGAFEVLGLEELLRGVLSYTVLAPRGLDALDTWDWHALMRPDSRARLESLVRRHIVPGRVYLDAGARLRNLEGEVLEVSGARGRQTLAGQRVMIGDIEAKNGLVHVIDGLLGP